MQFPIKLAQNTNAIWPSLSSELQASAKAWAANLNAHLGQIWSKSSSTVDLHPTEPCMDQPRESERGVAAASAGGAAHAPPLLAKRLRRRGLLLLPPPRHRLNHVLPLLTTARRCRRCLPLLPLPPPQLAPR
jgi:hypothetical protein